ncbi:MAG: hypothetical protein ILP02_02135, partial [Clostridia bacterium]|nr:hypothetical protein [Clostridia bacterium]
TPEKIAPFKSADVVAIVDRGKGAVNLKDELSGKSDRLLKLARATKDVKGLSLVSLTTDNYGLIRRSIAVFEKGRIIAIADGVRYDEGGFSPSVGYKTVTVCGVKIGLAVGRDVIDRDALNCFSLCDVDVIIDLSADFYYFSVETLDAAVSYIGGWTVVCSGAFGCVAYSRGKKIIASIEKEILFDVSTDRSYREYVVKRRI